MSFWSGILRLQLAIDICQLTELLGHYDGFKNIALATKRSVYNIMIFSIIYELRHWKSSYFQ